ncbi:MAG: hypothetical protein SV775_14295 [Thermodesulfobacteriota bacterium]|nr:hypothetical protein [Thermodesulfobacteriota bacterium]
MKWELSREVLYGMEGDVNSEREMELYLYDQDQYERVYVRAIIWDSQDKAPDEEDLWMRDFKGQLEEKPWKVRIVEKLPPPWESS